MGELIPFPTFPVITTKDEFVEAIRQLELPTNLNTYGLQAAKIRLEPQDIDGIPIAIKEYFGTGTSWLQVSILDGNSYSITILGPRGYHPRFALDASPNEPLRVEFWEHTQDLLPQYDPTTIDGRNKTGQLAGFLIGLARRKFRPLP